MGFIKAKMPILDIFAFLSHFDNLLQILQTHDVVPDIVTIGKVNFKS